MLLSIRMIGILYLFLSRTSETGTKQKAATRSEDNRVIGVIHKMSSLALFLSFLLATVVAVPAPRFLLFLNLLGCERTKSFQDPVMLLKHSNQTLGNKFCQNVVVLFVGQNIGITWMMIESVPCLTVIFKWSCMKIYSVSILWNSYIIKVSLTVKIIKCCLFFVALDQNDWHPVSLLISNIRDWD